MAMTTTLRQEDYVTVIYNGSYAVDVASEDRRSSSWERKTGPLPERCYEYNGSYDRHDSIAGMKKGQSRILPLEAIIVWFGDPRSVPGERTTATTKKGETVLIARREDEVRRSAVIHGLFHKVSELPKFVPDLTIKDDEGNVIVPPAMDPDGTHVYARVEDDRELTDVASLLKHHQAQIDRLQDMLDAKGNAGGDVKKDAPPEIG